LRAKGGVFKIWLQLKILLTLIIHCL
ncbi:unnamed protein product, partial [Callosobruchus maculatus]